MRRSTLALLLAATLPLGGCAYAALAPAVAEVINSAGQQRSYTAEELPPAAAEACRGYAARYGRVTIGTIESRGGNTLRVHGSVQGAERTRAFTCDFRSDGQITHFDRL